MSTVDPPTESFDQQIQRLFGDVPQSVTNSDVDVTELLKRRSSLVDIQRQLTDRLSLVKGIIERDENELVSYLKRNQQTSIAVKGLYSVSLVTSNIYKSTPEFNAWALKNSPSCLSVKIRQSGIEDYIMDNGDVPPHVKSVPSYKVSIRARK